MFVACVCQYQESDDANSAFAGWTLSLIIVIRDTLEATQSLHLLSINVYF